MSKLEAVNNATPELKKIAINIGSRWKEPSHRQRQWLMRRSTKRGGKQLQGVRDFTTSRGLAK